LNRSGSRELRCFADPVAVCRAGADEFLLAQQKSRDAGSRFRVALSGGSTPRLLHDLLRRPPYVEKIAWEEIDFFFGDERSVAPSHSDSNYRMARVTLFDELKIRADQIHRMQAERSDLDAAAREYEVELADAFGSPGREAGAQPPRIDLIFLGIGVDGHTASLFPGTSALAEQHRWVVGNPVPQLDCERMTFTYPLINAGIRVIFLVTGASKGPALKGILEGPRSDSPYPAQSVAPDDGRLLFLFDRPAAGELSAQFLASLPLVEPGDP
jgi:6-phosphogluconolactonase